MNTTRPEPKSDREIVKALINWANRWTPGKVKPNKIGKARRLVELWAVIDSAARYVSGPSGGLVAEYKPKPLPIREILTTGLAGSRFTPEEAEELCAQIMGRATKPSEQNELEHPTEGADG